MKVHYLLTGLLAMVLSANLATAQDAPKKAPPLSPPADTSATIGGKAISIKYSAPSVRGRKIFGAASAQVPDGTHGVLVPDGTIWRAGANEATALHTDGDVTIGTLKVPAGNYTLYVLVNAKGWQLIVSKQTGQWGEGNTGGTSLDTSKELGRTPMKMGKTASLVETYKMTLAGKGKKGSLTLEWEKTKATVAIAAK